MSQSDHQKSNAEVSESSYAASPPASRVRHQLTIWLSLAAVLAYLCRNSIAVAEKTIRLDLDLSEDQMGLILGPAFFWTYALAQIPTAWLGERFGSRRCLPLLSIAWSLATGCFGAARGMVLLLIGRMSLGLAQAGLFPCSTNSISLWHPRTERALASGALGASMSLGGAIGAVLTGWLLVIMDWRWIFVLYGIPGLIWAVGFWIWFRDLPSQHPRVNAAELATIGGEAERPPQHPAASAATVEESTPGVWLALITSPAMWAIASQQFFRAAGYTFFSSWFATYLQETRDVSTAQSGILLVGPLIATVLASLVGGGISDAVYRRTGSLRWARKGVAGFSLTACALMVLSAYFVDNAHGAVAVISMGVFFAGFAGPCAYAVSMDLGGKHVAAVFSTMNMIGNFGAGLLPWIVPSVRTYIDSKTSLLAWSGGNSWNSVLVLFGAMYILAAACWLLLKTEGDVFEQSLIRRGRNSR